MKTKILLFCLFSTHVLLIYAQPKEIKSITPEELRAHLSFVASDLTQGRDLNTPVPGLELTAAYLQAQCMKMGLKAPGSSYFQNMKLTAITPNPENTFLQLIEPDESISYETQEIYPLTGKNENDTIEGEIVFAGYGWYNAKTNYNDTRGIDIKDKIVVAMTRTLEMATADSTVKIDPKIEMKKLTKAMLGRAKALILIPDPLNPDTTSLNDIKKYSSRTLFIPENIEKMRRTPIPLLFASQEFADSLLQKNGKTLAQLQTEINNSAAPAPVEIKGTEISIVIGKSAKPVATQNVIALVEGRDPKLKDECIIYTAHYDHLGTTKNGQIFNGADDNGSGTVALLEIAEAFQKMKKKPRRSILFAWVTAEEKGLIGSNYYVNHPLMPLDQTILNINLDMIGRSAPCSQAPNAKGEKQLAGPDMIYVISGNKSPEILKLNKEICKKMDLDPNSSLSKKFLRGSDYYNFYKKNIPILGYSTGLHDDYHKVTDEIEKIDFNKMQRVAQLAFWVGYRAANNPKRPELKK